MTETARSAVHESGHVVAAFHFGRRIRSVSVDSGGEGATRCATIRPIQQYLLPRAAWRRECLREALICFAGPLAEFCATRTYDSASSAIDMQDGRRWLRRAGVSPLAVFHATRRLLREHWRAVEAIAERLEKSGYLTGERIAATLARGAQKLPAVASPGPSEGGYTSQRL